MKYERFSSTFVRHSLCPTLNGFLIIQLLLPSIHTRGGYGEVASVATSITQSRRERFINIHKVICGDGARDVPVCVLMCGSIVRSSQGFATI